MQRHIIKRQLMELRVPSQQGTFELQNRVSALYRNKIVPLIDGLFSQFSNADEIHRIDSLELDLGAVDINDLEALFVAKVEALLRKQLAEAIESNDNGQLHPEPAVETNEPQIVQQATAKQTRRSRPSSGQSAQPDQAGAQLELVKHFIQTGILPWWAEPLSQSKLAKCLDDLITDQPEQIKPVLLRNLKNQQQLRRLIEQFSDANLLAVVELLAPGLRNFITDLNADLLAILKSVDLVSHLSSNRLRLEQWQSLFFSLSSLPLTRSGDLIGREAKPPEHRAVKSQASNQILSHFATLCSIPFPTLIEQMVTAIAQLQRSGRHFVSGLPEIIEQIHNAKSNQQRDLSQPDTQQPTKEQSSSQENKQYRGTSKALSSDSRTLENLGDDLQKLDQDSLQRSKERFNDSDELYLSNAGLILLWPFLPRLFETLGLVSAQEFNDAESVERAVHLLQYLVDGSSEAPEHLLPLNKLLCGLDLAEPVSASIDITEQEKAECEKLLTAVIQHWTALKNTSVDGLRRAFLQREAILRVRDGGWLLQVERATHDVLLDRLPWSIRVVKLPWMEDVLYVEW